MGIRYGSVRARDVGRPSIERAQGWRGLPLFNEQATSVHQHGLVTGPSPSLERHIIPVCVSLTHTHPRTAN